jgi:SAM-dependent methyltransferase
MNINRHFKRLINQKFRFIRKSFGDNNFKMLDIGAGNHSASRITSLFPRCEYYGLDLNKEYNNDPADFKAMKKFYEMDLTKLDFSSIPDNYFDGIWIVHVMEHLYNGDKVVEGLIPKLKPGGYMYLEYPGQKSTKLPSMHGTLNFYDDDTHVRIYSVRELSDLFSSKGFEIIESGMRRNWYFITAMPFRIAGHWLRGKKLIGNIFWDILGFAEFIYVRKKKEN